MPHMHRADVAEAMQVSRLEGVPHLTWSQPGRRGAVQLAHDHHNPNVDDLISESPSSPAPSDAAASSSPPPSPTLPASSALETRSRSSYGDQVDRQPKRPRVSPDNQDEAQNNVDEEEDAAYAAGQVVRVLRHERMRVVQGPLWTSRRYDAAEVTYTVRLAGGSVVDGVGGEKIKANNDDKLVEYIKKTAGWRFDRKFKQSAGL